MKKKILIVYGGNSFEHEISCKSAKTIVDNIDTEKYIPTLVGISNYEWYQFNDDTNMLNNNTWLKGNITKIDNVIEYLKQFDKIFPIIHGNDGENGNLSGFFNLFNIDYVGSDVKAHAIGYDKELTKIICDYYNIPQIPYFVINKNEEINDIPIEYPVIIKPASCGSSIGINIANNIKEVNKYVQEAFNYDNKVIVEKFINCQELECAVLENKSLITTGVGEKNKKLKVSCVGEIKSINTFYDYDAKYNKESNLIIPANIPEEIKNKIMDYSLEIFKILELKDLSRIDFLYDFDNQKLYFNEVNTIPGFTKISMYPMLFNAKGINIKELITLLIEE